MGIQILDILIEILFVTAILVTLLLLIVFAKVLIQLDRGLDIIARAEREARRRLEEESD